MMIRSLELRWPSATRRRATLAQPTRLAGILVVAAGAPGLTDVTWPVTWIARE
jgi:hypothetical protein